MAAVTSTTAASRRRIVPTKELPQSSTSEYETSYQRAYFAQLDEPRACTTTFEKVERVRYREPPSAIPQVLTQSKTTMKDCAAMSRSNYSNPTKGKEDRPAVRFDKIQQPKQLPPQYPQPLEPTRMRLR